MATKFSIYIPSYGRHTNATTPSLLRICGIPFTLVVEPSEYEAYKKNFPYAKFLVLEQNEGGLAYSRRSIQKYSESQGEEYHWQIDDDVMSFKIRRDGKNSPASATQVLNPIEDYVDQYQNIGLACPNHAFFAFSSKEDFSLNGSASNCVLIRNNTGNYFRLRAVMDKDLSMQILTSNYATVRFNRLLFDCGYTGDSGGLALNVYKDNGRAEAVLEFIEQWKQYEQYFKPSPKDPNRMAPSRIWSIFKQELVLKDKSND